MRSSASIKNPGKKPAILSGANKTAGHFYTYIILPGNGERIAIAITAI